MPVAHFYIVQTVSEQQFVRRMAQKNLETCYIILEEMKANNWRADLMIAFLKGTSQLISMSQDRNAHQQPWDLELGDMFGEWCTDPLVWSVQDGA
jgi:hypothetical protein